MVALMSSKLTRREMRVHSWEEEGHGRRRRREEGGGNVNYYHPHLLLTRA